MTPQDPDYSTLVARAEAAVKSVKDPELKRVAFQKVLDDLLSFASKRSKTEKPQAAGHRLRKSTRGGPQEYIREMASEDFFKKPKTIAQVKAELENRGHHIPLTSLSTPLQRLCQKHVLRRQRTKDNGNKQVFSYTEW